MRAINNLFGIGCLFAMGSCAGSNPSADRTMIACEILADFVSVEIEQNDRPLFLSEEPILPRSSNHDDLEQLADEILMHQESARDREEILLQLREEKRLSTVKPIDACTQLTFIKKEKSFIPPHKMEDEPPETTPDGLFYQYDTLAVGMPFVDLERGQAEFEVSRVCGPLCGGGAIILYTVNEHGNWVKKSETGTWIS